MPRVSGVDIPPNKRLDVALTYVYGIGPYLAKQLLADVKIDPAKRSKELTEEQVAQINQWLEEHAELEVKLVNTTVGEWQGKIKEPALIVQIWV